MIGVHLTPPNLFKFPNIVLKEGRAGALHLVYIRRLLDQTLNLNAINKLNVIFSSSSPCKPQARSPAQNLICSR